MSETIHQQQRKKRDRAEAFVEFLCGLVAREERGALAAMRRSLQDSQGMAASAFPYVVPFLPDEPDRYRERMFFLVAALFSLHPEHAVGVSLGHVFQRLNAATSEGSASKDNESIRGRFVALLDAHPDDVAEHVRHAVSLARGKGIALDYADLLRNLLRFRDPDRPVQRKLARDFWRRDASTAESPTAVPLAAPESEVR